MIFGTGTAGGGTAWANSKVGDEIEYNTRNYGQMECAGDKFDLDNEKGWNECTGNDFNLDDEFDLDKKWRNISL